MCRPPIPASRSSSRHRGRLSSFPSLPRSGGLEVAPFLLDLIFYVEEQQGQGGGVPDPASRWLGPRQQRARPRRDHPHRDHRGAYRRATRAQRRGADSGCALGARAGLHLSAPREGPGQAPVGARHPAALLRRLTAADGLRHRHGQGGRDRLHRPRGEPRLQPRLGHRQPDDPLELLGRPGAGRPGDARPCGWAPPSTCPACGWPRPWPTASPPSIGWPRAAASSVWAPATPACACSARSPCGSRRSASTSRSCGRCSAARRSTTRSEGETHPIRFQMREHRFIDLEHPIPLYMAAFGPRAQALAGELGDGLISGLPRGGTVPDMLANARRGAARAGRSLAAGLLHHRDDDSGHAATPAKRPTRRASSPSAAPPSLPASTIWWRSTWRRARSRPSTRGPCGRRTWTGWRRRRRRCATSACTPATTASSIPRRRASSRRISSGHVPDRHARGAGRAD